MKNFLPYKESIKMKELGFDEPCLGHWTNIDNQPEFSYNKKPTKYSKMFTKKSPHCVAPLYQEAFDWFTEQGLFSYIDRKYTTGKYEYEYLITTDSRGNRNVFGFETKRLAETACINELAKLLYSNKEHLKQVKRNNKLNELGI
jgi:hypothetical protein